MRKILLLRIFLVIGIITIARFAFADGVFFSDYDPKTREYVIRPFKSTDSSAYIETTQHLYEPSQKAVISWDGRTETMIIAAAVKSSEVANFAWVIPVRSSQKPRVSEAGIFIFEDLVKYFSVPSSKKKERFSYRTTLKEGGFSGVEVVETKEVDIYDVTILKATDARDLVAWLDQNGYRLPARAQALLQKYVAKGDCYFIANKIDIKNRFYHGEAAGTASSQLAIEKTGEYARILNQLQRGIATPLRIEFEPPAPYYPLEISSLNAGDGTIEVYVFHPGPVYDANGILGSSESRAITWEFRSVMAGKINIGNARYVTRLSYKGVMKNLTKDALFARRWWRWF